MAVVPSPNWPLEPTPHVNNLPSERIAAVWAPPALITVQLIKTVPTSDPTCPSKLEPHACKKSTLSGGGGGGPPDLAKNCSINNI